MITWEQFMGFASVQRCCVLKAQQPAQMLCRVEKLWSESTAQDVSTLYIMTAEMLPTVRFGKRTSAVILSDETVHEVPEELSNCAVLERNKLSVLLEELDSSFERERKFDQEVEKLLAMVREAADMETLTEELSRWLERPVAIVDSSYRFVTKTQSDLLDSFVPQEDRDPNGLTDERLKMLMQSGVLYDYLESTSPRYYQIGEFTIYSIPLYLKGTMVGQLGIPGMAGGRVDKLPVEYINGLKKLAVPFEIAFAFRSKALHKRRQNLAFMFSYLLEQEPDDMPHVTERLRLFGYTLLPNMYLVSVKNKQGKKFDSQVVADALRNIFSNSFYLSSGNELLFLISRPADRGLSESELSIWDYQLGAMELQAGISKRFTDFKSIRRVSYKEAVLAQRAGRVDGQRNLYCFEDCLVDAFLADYPDVDMLSSYQYEPLVALMKYDEEKGTQLTETLREYLKNPKLPQEACSRLFIHKNTLYKRLAKAEEIMGCNPFDPEVIMQIQMTFHVMKFLDGKNIGSDEI